MTARQLLTQMQPFGEPDDHWTQAELREAVVYWLAFGHRNLATGRRMTWFLPPNWRN